MARLGKFAVLASAVGVVLLVASVKWAGAADDRCLKFTDKLRLARFELEDFERSVVEPLRTEERKLNQLLEERRRETARLRQEIDKNIKPLNDLKVRKMTLPSEITRMNERLEEIPTQIDELETRKKGLPDGILGVERKKVEKRIGELKREKEKLPRSIQDAERTLRTIDSDILVLESRNIANAKLIADIESRVPSVNEIDARLRSIALEWTEINAPGGLRDRKRRDADDAQEVVSMCRDNQKLEGRYAGIRDRISDVRKVGMGCDTPLRTTGQGYGASVDAQNYNDGYFEAHKLMCQ
jgi:chromosome segregation ATPase